MIPLQETLFETRLRKLRHLVMGLVLVGFVVLLAYHIKEAYQWTAPEEPLLAKAQAASVMEDICQAPELIDYAQPDYPEKPGTIFVSVASYRDDECKDTVNQMFEAADNPNRIFVGVVQQNKEDKEDCFSSCETCKRRKNSGHIRVKNFTHDDARGPTFARFHCSTLWRGEQYYFQIDSHTKFEKGWDTTLIDQMERTGDPKAIIGGYPPAEPQMEKFKEEGFKNMIIANRVKINSDGIPDIVSAIVPVPEDGKPKKMYFSGAGMMCMPGRAIVDVPYDPYLSYLFFGEEIVHCARLWTAGYNFYGPTVAFVVHHYGRGEKPHFWDDKQSSFKPCKEKAIKRALYLLSQIPLSKVPEGYRRDIKKYGMGTQRTLEQYFDEAGIPLKPKNKTIT